MITAKVELTQALGQRRKFVAQSGSGHTLVIDDAAGGTGPKPIELVAVGLAGCTAFDVTFAIPSFSSISLNSVVRKVCRWSSS